LEWLSIALELAHWDTNTCRFHGVSMVVGLCRYVDTLVTKAPHVGLIGMTLRLPLHDHEYYHVSPQE